MKISNKLRNWMNNFYHYSSDEDNKDSKLTEEFQELKEIIKEIKLFESRGRGDAIPLQKVRDAVEKAIKNIDNCDFLTAFDVTKQMFLKSHIKELLEEVFAEFLNNLSSKETLAKEGGKNTIITNHKESDDELIRKAEKSLKELGNLIGK